MKLISTALLMAALALPLLAQPGKGTYRVNDNPAQPIQSMKLNLSKDGKFTMGISLGGDGLEVTGSYTRKPGWAVLQFAKFSGSSLEGRALVALDGAGKPTHYNGYFYFSKQKTLHAFDFSAK